MCVFDAPERDAAVSGCLDSFVSRFSSSDSLLGPKDSQKVPLLDARELLKHFTAEGRPTGELQPLAVNRR